jgi:hypothetical protein
MILTVVLLDFADWENIYNGTELLSIKLSL